MPDGDHRRVEDGDRAEATVADGGDDTNFHSRIVLIHPDERADHHVEVACLAEVMCVV